MKPTVTLLLTAPAIGVTAAPAARSPQPEIMARTSTFLIPRSPATKTLASGTIGHFTSVPTERPIIPRTQVPLRHRQTRYPPPAQMTDAPWKDPLPPWHDAKPPDPSFSSSEGNPMPPTQISIPLPPGESIEPAQSPPRTSDEPTPSAQQSNQPAPPAQSPTFPAQGDPFGRFIITSVVSNSCPFPVYISSATCCPPGMNCTTPTHELEPNGQYSNITHATNDSCGQAIKISRTADWTSEIYQIEYTVEGDLVWYNLSAIDGDPFWEVKRFLEVRGEGCEAMLCPAGEQESACNWPTLGDCEARIGNDVRFQLC